MGFWDLFRRKTDDEKELEEVTRRAKAAQAQMAQQSQAQAAGFTPKMSLEDTIPEVKKLLAQERKIYAVKYVKDNTGVGLAEAKAFVEKYE